MEAKYIPGVSGDADRRRLIQADRGGRLSAKQNALTLQQWRYYDVEARRPRSVCSD
jgi:hypothetical protein